MAKEGRPFKGCLFFGLMLTPKGPKVIEYNCRFGDPETQVVLPRLQTDLLDIVDAIREERLAELDIRWKEEACACVVMASGGYPAAYRKGLPIAGLDQDGQLQEAYAVYHAGTAWKDGRFYTNGGRVLGVTAVADTVAAALDKAYEAVQHIEFENAHYRKDIENKKTGMQRAACRFFYTFEYPKLLTMASIFCLAPHWGHSWEMEVWYPGMSFSPNIACTGSPWDSWMALNMAAIPTRRPL